MRVTIRGLSLTLLAATVFGIGLSDRTGFGQTPFPMLMSVKPVAVQAGTSAELELSSRYSMYGAGTVLVSGAGVTGEVVTVSPKLADGATEKPSVTKLKIKLTVAADAIPGVRDLRILTAQGASTMGQVVVVKDPVFHEAGDNDIPAKAFAVTLPATLCGAIEKAEDVDCFKFKVDAGTGLTFHMRCGRLQDRIHDLQLHADPILTIRNSSGSIVAQVDNYYAADPVLFHHFEHAGEYVAEIRDVRYKGNAEWMYCVEVTSAPYVTTVFPIAVAPGSNADLSLIGFSIPSGAKASVNTSDRDRDFPSGLATVVPQWQGKPLNSASVVVTTLPRHMESPMSTGSNLAPAAGGTPAAAATTQVTVPGVLNGRIATAGEIDRWTFAAKKGESYTFEVVSRRAGTQLDAHIRLLDAKGKQILEADDLRLYRITSNDAQIETWTCPLDGEYTLEVRDLLLRGGEMFSYAVVIDRAQPHFLLEVDTDKTLLAPGIAAPVYVRVERRCGFTGEIELSIENLPAGVTLLPGRILPEAKDGCMILQADAAAKPVGANVRVIGKAKTTINGEEKTLVAEARALQETYLPGGGRGHYPVEFHTVSVADPMDLRAVVISESAITLKPGESKKVEVKLTRAPGMKQNVTLDIQYQHLGQMFGTSLTKGLTVDTGKSKTLLNGDDSTGFIMIKAAPDAVPVEKQLVPVMAHVSVNFVMKMTYCAPIYVTVEPAEKK